eukprot:scaffold28647_cov19-Prasinocladus_malaysianus.AAC.2
MAGGWIPGPTRRRRQDSPDCPGQPRSRRQRSHRGQRQVHDALLHTRPPHCHNYWPGCVLPRPQHQWRLADLRRLLGC